MWSGLGGRGRGRLGGRFRIEPLDLRFQPAVLVAQIPIGLLQLIEPPPRPSRRCQGDQGNQERERGNQS